MRRAEDFAIRFESDNGPPPIGGGAKRFKFAYGMSARKTLAIKFAVACNFDVHPFGKRVYDGSADAVQSARSVIDFAAEFPAGMQSCHDHFERRLVGEFRMPIHGNSPAVVAHRQDV